MKNDITLDVTQFQFFKNLTTLNYINNILLYGSRARGDNRDRSDIDLAIDCPLATEQQWLTIIDIIENADTLLHIDCVRLDQLQDQDFKKNILNQGKKLFTRSNNE